MSQRKKELLGCSIEQLKDVMIDLGQPAFRAKQVAKWLVSCTPFEEMSNLPESLRIKLREQYSEGYPKVVKKLDSADGSSKFLLETGDGQCVESVLMQNDYGNTICLSTQAGCAMNCSFCASCRGGLIRNLTAGEMLGEVLVLNASMGPGRNIKNLVLMGSGEPFANYDNVMQFLRMINSPDTLGISYRNISLSTCGLIPQIKAFAKEDIPLTMCLSLHSPFDEVRKEIMPIGKKYTVEDTVAAMREYQQLTGRRVIFEYLILPGINNRPEDVQELGRLLKNMIAHINLIPYHAVEECSYQAPTKAQVYGFLEDLQNAGISATVRRSLGKDIAGACGQLRAGYKKTH